MSEKDMFEAPENKEEKRLKFETAAEDGVCTQCQEEYKKGDRIALYKREEPNTADEKFKPYHNECLDDELNPEFREN